MEPEKCHQWLGEFILYYTNNADCISNIKHTTYFNEITEWIERNTTVCFNPMTERWIFWCSVIFGYRINSWSALFLLVLCDFLVFWRAFCSIFTGLCEIPCWEDEQQQVFQEGSGIKCLSYSPSRLPACVNSNIKLPCPLSKAEAQLFC